MVVLLSSVVFGVGVLGVVGVVVGGGDDELLLLLL